MPKDLADLRVVLHLEEPGKPGTPKQLSSAWALKKKNTDV